MAGWSWFPDKKGVVNGVVLTGFGAGGFVFNLIGKVFVYGGNRVVDRGAGGGDGGRRQGVFWRETTGRFSVMLSRIDPSRLSTRSVPLIPFVFQLDPFHLYHALIPVVFQLDPFHLSL